MLFGCAIISAMVWMLFFHGSASIEAQKWLQFCSVVGTFLLPPIICAYLWDEDKKPLRWLKMDRGAHWSHFIMGIVIMIAALPAINLMAYFNSLIPMPEQFVTADLNAEATIREFLKADNIGLVLLNIGLMALLPAIAEEMTFRGTLQQILGNRVHLAIWLTAIVFSAIHMQFLGFIPRMLMGALFGYIFVWTGSLWVPIVMHFTNNAVAIAGYYVLPDTNNYADTIGAGTTWYLGLISLILTYLGLLIFYRRTHTR